VLCSTAQQILRTKRRDGSLAQIEALSLDVRFTPKSGHWPKSVGRGDRQTRRSNDEAGLIRFAEKAMLP